MTLVRLQRLLGLEKGALERQQRGYRIDSDMPDLNDAVGQIELDIFEAWRSEGDPQERGSLWHDAQALRRVEQKLIEWRRQPPPPKTK